MVMPFFGNVHSGPREKPRACPIKKTTIYSAEHPNPSLVHIGVPDDLLGRGQPSPEVAAAAATAAAQARGHPFNGLDLDLPLRIFTTGLARALRVVESNARLTGNAPPGVLRYVRLVQTYVRTMKVVNKYNGCNILTCTLLSVYVRNFDPEQGRTTMPIVVFTTRADHASWLLLLLRNVAKDRFGEGPQDRIKAIWAGIQTNDWTKEFFARPNAKVDEVDVLVTTSDILTLQPRDLPSAVRGCRLEPVARYRLPEVYVLHFRSRQLIEGAEADVSRLFNEYYDQYKISVLLIQATGVITGPANCPVENLILKPLDEIQRWVTAATMELMAGRTGPVRAVFIVAWATLWGMSCYCSVPSQS